MSLFLLNKKNQVINFIVHILFKRAPHTLKIAFFLIKLYFLNFQNIENDNFFFYCMRRKTHITHQIINHAYFQQDVCT